MPVQAGLGSEQKDRGLLLRRRVSHICCQSKFYEYPVIASLRTFANMGTAQSARVFFSYLYSCIKKKPEDNLENYYINRFGKALYEMFFESYTQKLWEVHPEKIDPSWGAQRVKGLSFRKLWPGQG